MVQAASSRDQVKAELCALAQTHIDNWESYASTEVSDSTAGYEFKSRQTVVDG